MKKIVGIVFFMLAAGLLFSQGNNTYYHIEVYSRNGNSDPTHFSVNTEKLIEGEGYYEFYHATTGYAFFVYATSGGESAVTAPSVYSKIFDWLGTSSTLRDTQISKILTQDLLTRKAEVEKLQSVLKYKLVVPREL